MADNTIILFHTVLLILNISNLPADQKDWSYHLMIAKMFVEEKSFLWDYYEFAPIGRPHLYPPFLHLLFAATNILGMGWVTIQKFYGILIYPVSLLSTFFVSRDLFGKKVGLFAVVILSASYNYWWWQISIAPTSLIFGLFPLAMWTVYKKKTILSIALLSVFLWTHFSSFLVVLAVGIFGVLKRDYLKYNMKIIAVSLITYIPWAIHVIMNRDWIHGNWSSFSNMPTFGVVTIIFSLLGVYFLLKRRDVKDILILSAIPSTILVGVLYGFRFFMHAPVILAILMALGAYETSTRIDKNAVYVFLIAFLLISYTGEPTLRLMGRGGPQIIGAPGPEARHGTNPIGEAGPLQGFSPVVIQSTPLKENLNALLGMQPRILKISPYLSEDAYKLYDFIIKNTNKDEIIHVQGGPIATCISLFTDRRTDNGMWREVTNEEMGKSPPNNSKYGVMELNNLQRINIPQEIIIEKFGQYIIYDATKAIQIKLPQEQPRIPPLLIELSIEFRQASAFLGTDTQVATRHLIVASEKLNQLSKGAPDEKGRRILERSSIILRNKASIISNLQGQELQRVKQELLTIANLYERGDIGGALVILEKL
ncbi:MAG: hypothetical protein APG12_01619 [Candidatus Methanofastidiosum methylothiophilum]|uniref:Glycosyltransferase RgtA/B/C/D-like domain-containing protein n=1 Tax=Candidatus Methanofastidiosum methylothiophilum TaxID=1705564 RepID=A0A150IW81_9EURY|nr:MAG: hypothetical protein APG10_01530 [Candidatus Methanofastidiosum methylthiophilus]KYC46750.1 MAG: hypothetical protein APG11_01690 [Candidatus Methanofastidiosum methylthiophilus]KYC49237.1 MAG: hypothetical protein APG12_01619 [Candidatus Methanofastidiosum methylthiophilus]